ncbi:nodulation protein NfeD [Brevundimonas sp. Leaf280]|jgi:membrane protein implicated in regulation of membrane protease activity|uniref:NfeD family protein n=1 Tax=Brevundimonas nasdae TaxID=172043 RepID=A0ACD4VJC4_9CAUL|nr:MULTISPECIES: NfeD family protein [Brevundimonas]KQP46498.1 nodulation protein NfeD [Brevundimonas sp. Leaf280]NSX31983.1 NfeD family protein [Brevundimonas vesicularis]WBT05084.1 NfeD family protein [Brevundimonas vesicularis]WOB77690.1 NfeD family protein [Brevundimonas nasdae]
MMSLADLYVAQPFWIWLAIGVLLLAVEAMFSTEWLLWPAVSAGVVAVMTAAGVRLGLPGEVAVFAVLTVIATLLSRRLISKANPDGPDINDRDSRLVGQRARVVETFVSGRGRVFISGAEWPAEIVGEAPVEGQDVVVMRVNGSLLTVQSPV